MDVSNGVAQQLGDRQNKNAGALLCRPTQWDRIGHDDLGERAFLDLVDRGTGQNRVCRESVDRLGAISHERLGSLRQGAGGILIGRRGTTLAALSYLVELIVNRSEAVRVKVFVDVAGYLERKRRSLVTLAQELAAEAAKTGREVSVNRWVLLSAR